MKREVSKMGIAAEKLTAVPMGISPNLAAVEFVAPPGDAKVAYLGTLARTRRLDIIIRAFRFVVDALPDAKLYLVGGDENDGHDERLLRDEVERLGLRDHVVFTGFLPREQALEHVARADVCVSPLAPTPVFDVASPTKLYEYMALGRAVVGNHHPEQRAVIEESQCGLSVDWDERAFADAVIELLRDHRRAAEMGKRGQRFVREHRNYDRIAQLVESRFLELDAASRPHRSQRLSSGAEGS
jgi:glycosyltransferase involved in cell wall biosynthesis